VTGQGAPSPDSQPITPERRGSHPKGAKRPPKGVDGPVGGCYVALPLFLPAVVSEAPRWDVYATGIAAAFVIGAFLLGAATLVGLFRRLLSEVRRGG
jgi:hypothetical protein